MIFGTHRTKQSCASPGSDGRLRGQHQGGGDTGSLGGGLGRVARLRVTAPPAWALPSTTRCPLRPVQMTDPLRFPEPLKDLISTQHLPSTLLVSSTGE